jgi:hypothetical protein
MIDVPAAPQTFTIHSPSVPEGGGLPDGGADGQASSIPVENTIATQSAELVQTLSSPDGKTMTTLVAPLSIVTGMPSNIRGAYSSSASSTQVVGGMMMSVGVRPADRTKAILLESSQRFGIVSSLDVDESGAIRFASLSGPVCQLADICGLVLQ